MKHIMNYGKTSPYKVAKADGGPYATKPQTNHSGERMTKLSGGASKRQVNHGHKANITVRDATEGVRGTGSQGGF